ncbi:putative Nudix hydrolase NudL [Methylobacterium bullatum]|uniref:Putative Nudix hydrolase NudL n=1 Tax=Methylobacterium bullatum TaxID=570505 RepID=A0A679J5H9_9HYPH|nr:putative Nudix hydrolase NudL [Methylobacterium bullatum]
MSFDALSDLLDRAGRGLSPAPPKVDDPISNPRGDHDLDPFGIAIHPGRPHRPAAVLVPVIVRDGDLSVLFTVRASHLRDHSGQIAFPGGKIEPSDGSPADAALREAREEIGLHRDDIRILGYLDPYLSATGFLVVPVVGLCAGGVRLTPDPAEVAEVFEVPLARLMDPIRRRLGVGIWQDRPRRYYAIPFGDRMIWGVTAGIVNNLHERLFP